MKLLKTYHSIDKIEPLREEVSKIEYQAIRDLFLHPPAKSGVTPSWGEIKPDAIRAFLVDEHSFSAERVDAAVKRVAGLESSKTETLEKWFG
jgi:flap endonuclease-1